MNGISSEPTIQKFWILPSGVIQKLERWHADFIMENPEVVGKFGVDAKGLHPRDDEQEIRLRALRAGFVRLRYRTQGGSLTVEGHNEHFNETIRHAIKQFVAENAPYIDNITIRLLADVGEVVQAGSARMFVYDDAEKAKHIPLISKGSD